MKVHNKIILFLTFSFLLASCTKDFMEVSPLDQLSDVTFWKSENDATLALTGLYSEPQGGDSYLNINGIYCTLWWDLMTDNGYSQFPWDGISVMGNGQLNAANPGRSYFDYKKIRRYNNFLDKIEKVNMDPSKKEIYKAEARFLRAYDYFRKVQFYGDVPLVTKTIENPSDANLARNPKEEVINFILKELDEVAKILPIQNMRQSKGHVVSGSALGLKARLELYIGNYSAAMVDAKKVMDMPVFELFPDYRGLFLIDNEDINKESILEQQYLQDTYANVLWQHILPAKEGGWSSISAVQSIVDAYEMLNGKVIDDPTSGYDPIKPYENRDPRLGMSILYPGAKYNGRYFDSLNPSSPDYHQNAAAPRSGYNILKYSKIVPSSLFRNGGENIMEMRLAEILLIYAEAAIETNKITDEMYNTIDQVRQRSGMPKVDRLAYNSQAKLRELIRRERRVELAFEGLRYWDIKRWDLGSTTLNGPLYGSLEGSVDPETGVVTWGSTRIKIEDRVFQSGRKYLLPIPQLELDANPNIKQNPGY